MKRLWRQLVVTCMAFGIRSTENQRYERALELLKRAEILLSRWGLIVGRILGAEVFDVDSGTGRPLLNKLKRVFRCVCSLHVSSVFSARVRNSPVFFIVVDYG